MTVGLNVVSRKIINLLAGRFCGNAIASLEESPVRCHCLGGVYCAAELPVGLAIQLVGAYEETIATPVGGMCAEQDGVGRNAFIGVEDEDIAELMAELNIEPGRPLVEEAVSAIQGWATIEDNDEMVEALRQDTVDDTTAQLAGTRLSSGLEKEDKKEEDSEWR